MKSRATVAARTAESSQFDGKRKVLIGTLSVWPSTVARLFIDNGVAPPRLTAAGYADQRPVADNADEEGRGRNRRVTILIESRMADPEGTAGPTSIPPDDPIRSILPEDPQG